MNNKTIHFFKEISQIPRESGNEKQISDFICAFAKERNLEFIQDKYGNVIIKKYNGENLPIIFQAHMDMVCEKEDIEFDFKKDPINIYEENGYIKAKGTTLGADNGIGVAQILNILDDDLKLNIEAIFTVSEETTMCGAENIDVSSLKGNIMINLDGFEEKTIITESASFYDIVMNLNYERKDDLKSSVYKVVLSGMEGGHSGFDIDKNRGNSSIELAQFLSKIEDVQISNFIGGTKFNVIPSYAESIFCSELNEQIIKNITQDFRKQLLNKYKTANITLEKIKVFENSEINPYIRTAEKILSKEESQRFIKSITSFKHGVYFKNENNSVTTSVNLGVVDLKNNILKIGVRSSKKIEEEKIIKELKDYAQKNNYEFVILGNQPGFETKKESGLVKNLCMAYDNAIGDNKLKVKPVHITVESGFFINKIPNLQVAIISPKIIGAHTTSERVEIKSIFECDTWIYEFLKVFLQ